MDSDVAPWPRMIVGDVAIDLVDREAALSLIRDSLSRPNSLVVASANLDHIHHFADSDPWIGQPSAGPLKEFDSELRWLTLLDGAPLVKMANVLTGRRWHRLSGSDLIEPILESATDLGVRVGFLGGEVDTHRQLYARLHARFPSMEIAGTWAPSRWELTDPAASTRLAQEIREAEVDILVVGLGKPLQEKWIASFGHLTGARVLLAFGAAIDFLAHRVRRAPQLVAEAGAEWLWRLMLEPRRLARRYLIEGPPALLRLKRTARVEAPITDSVPSYSGDRPKFVGHGEYANVAVVLVTHNSARDVSPLIDDLRLAARDRPIRLIAVDNQSSDNTVEVLSAHHDIILVEPQGNLGYAGGINAGLPFVGNCDHILILNPDLTLEPAAIARLVAAADDERIGAVVPLILNDRGEIHHSLRREPSLSRMIFDALLGSKIHPRPRFSSEVDLRRASYHAPHDVDWATGAALLVPYAVARDVGQWSEEFFLYSEEVDYFRRIRMNGWRVRFEPSAVVRHRGGGSGSSPALEHLLAVNRVRYIQHYRGKVYATAYRAAVALWYLLRSYHPNRRRTLAVVLNRRRWQELPRATKPVAPQHFSGQRQRGAVIIPAYNEAVVIARTLAPLSRAAIDGYIELIVVCNGCTDNTAEVARGVPGVRVVELAQGSKPAALNAGDEVATTWPRLYLDADVQISAEAVIAVLDRLTDGDALVAVPESQHDWRNASALVRSYYRARDRTFKHQLAMWHAGAYGLSEKGHERFGAFPAVTADDLYVDTQFDAHEKAVVRSAHSLRKTPTDMKNLLAVMRRHHRGGAELLAREGGSNPRLRETGLRTALSVLRTIRGPKSAVDAGVFLGMAIAARGSHKSPEVWERDESSRSIY